MTLLRVPVVALGVAGVAVAIRDPCLPDDACFPVDGQCNEFEDCVVNEPGYDCNCVRGCIDTTNDNACVPDDGCPANYHCPTVGENCQVIPAGPGDPLDPSPGDMTVPSREEWWGRFYSDLSDGAYVEGTSGWWNVLHEETRDSECLLPGEGAPGPDDKCGYPQLMSVDSAINAFIGFGADPEKLVMGVAHYGRVFRNVENGSKPNGGNSDGLNAPFDKMCAWDFWDCARDDSGVIQGEDYWEDAGAEEDRYCYMWKKNNDDSTADNQAEASEFNARLELKECGHGTTNDGSWMEKFTGAKGEPRFLAYHDIEKLVGDESFTETFDWSAFAPTAWNDEGYYITYDNAESIEAKAKYVKEGGLGGLMWWMSGQDTDDLKLHRASFDNLNDAGAEKLAYYLVEAGGPRGEDVQDGRDMHPSYFLNETSTGFGCPFDYLTTVTLAFFNIEEMNAEANELATHPSIVTIPRYIRNDQVRLQQWLLNVVDLFRVRQTYWDDDNQTTFANGGRKIKLSMAIGGWALGNRNAPDAYAYSRGVSEEAVVSAENLSEHPQAHVLNGATTYREVLFNSAKDFMQVEFLKEFFCAGVNGTDYHNGGGYMEQACNNDGELGDAANCAQICHEILEGDHWEFDVFDMDWEYPGQKTNNKLLHGGEIVDCFNHPGNVNGMDFVVGGAGVPKTTPQCEWSDDPEVADVQGLTEFFKMIKENTDYKTSIASAGAIYSLSFLLGEHDGLRKLSEQLDQINVMTYDYAGTWLQRNPLWEGEGASGEKGSFGSYECRPVVEADNHTWKDVGEWACFENSQEKAMTAHHTNLFPSVTHVNFSDP
eukprot:gene104-622_t